MAALNRGLALGLALLTGCQPDESKPTPQVAAPEPEETTESEPEVEPDEDPPADDTAPPEDDDEEEEEDVVPSLPALTDLQLLTRLSLDLRGTRPTVDEMDRLEADPAELDTLVEEYLAHPRFGDRIRYMYDDIFHVDTRTFYADFGRYAPEDSPFDYVRWLISIGEEPLRIVQKVAEDDLPWTDVVTADWTMANEQLAVFYPVDYPAGETGWKQVSWTDERPPGGVLVTNGWHNRYISQGVNYHRRRANEVSRSLLCDNYLGRPIEFSREDGITDEESTQNATQTKAACVACHVSLDPLASHFWGFEWQSYGIYDQFRYHVSKERYWEEETGVPPSYYGRPSNGLIDLGHHIAADPRFSSCTVEQMMGFLFQEETTLASTETFNHHREAFLASGMRMKALIRSLVSDPIYRAAFDNTEVSTARLVTDDMLRTSIQELTGYELRNEGIFGDQDILARPEWRTVAGGLNGITVRSRSPYISMPMVLLHEQLSQAAATYAAFTELDLPVEERTLFVHVDFTETPDSHPDAFAEQVQHLLHAVLAEKVDVDAERVTALVALWSALYDTQGTHWTVDDEEEQRVSAWAGVLTAILRDPTFLVY